MFPFVTTACILLLQSATIVKSCQFGESVQTYDPAAFGTGTGTGFEQFTNFGADEAITSFDDMDIPFYGDYVPEQGAQASNQILEAVEPPRELSPEQQSFNLCDQLRCKFDGTRSSKQYVKADLKPGKKAKLESIKLKQPMDKMEKFRFHWYATDKKIQVRALCSGQQALQFLSKSGSEMVNRWVESEFACPKGTKQIQFECESKGGAKGTCALDKVTVLNPLNEMDICWSPPEECKGKVHACSPQSVV